MADLVGILTDLADEGRTLEGLVGQLDDAGWRTPTPADGWTVGHQIAHLAWTDEVALLAATDPERFGSTLERQVAEHGGIDGFVDAQAARGAEGAPDELLRRWQGGREALAAALVRVPEGVKLPWFGPPMSAASMATARLMETWAHGQDVADALGVRRTPGAGLRHVAHLGVRTRDFAYAVHGRTPPAEEFGITLRAPDGGEWSWGPADATQRVTGPAEDFCLLVTRRRHRDDLHLVASGADAQEWLTIAQAFAGPPGIDRPAAGTGAPVG